MAQRKTISKKIRFEVFKRDNFTCQYCGRMAPDVVLEVDHINPVANGGDNEIMNLITSCFDCNRGKGKKTLSDSSSIKLQQEQLKELNAKRDQLKMILEWKKELNNFKNEQLEEFINQYTALTGNTLTDFGKEKVNKWISKFGLIEVLECAELSVSQYFDENDRQSWEKTFNYIVRIAENRKKQSDNPMYSKQCYIRGILRNRISYVNEHQLLNMLKVIKTNDDFEEIKDIALNCKNWTEFKEDLIIWNGGDINGN